MPDVEHSEATGTVFDVSVLYDDGMYKMYASWRPNGSVSYTSSQDGFTWDQNFRHSLAGEPTSSWEAWINRPFVLKRGTGEYIMWYANFLGRIINVGIQDRELWADNWE